MFKPGKISVIIPAYNVEKYLADCLDSVIGQTYKNWECLCMNDGSKDNTWSVIQQYAKKDKRIRALSQKNAGVTKTRNTLLGLADGEFIYFIDSDDYLHPQNFDILMKTLQKTKADVVECSCTRVWNENPRDHFKPIKSAAFKTVVYDDMDIFLTKKKRVGGWLNIWNKLYRFKPIQKIRFSELLVNEDDYFYVSQVYANIKRKAAVDASLYFYRENPTSLTRSLNYERYQKSAIARIQLSYDYFIKGNRIPEKYLEDFKSDLAIDAYRMIIRKSLKKCPDSTTRHRLFNEASSAMKKYVKGGVIEPKYLSPLQRVVVWLARHKFYHLSRLFVFAT